MSLCEENGGRRLGLCSSFVAFLESRTIRLIGAKAVWTRWYDWWSKCGGEAERVCIPIVSMAESVYSYCINGRGSPPAVVTLSVCVAWG